MTGHNLSHSLSPELANVINYVSKFRGLEQGKNPLSVAAQKAILEYFIRTADLQPEISVAAIRTLSQLYVDHPTTWQARAEVNFRTKPRLIQIPRDWPEITPPSPAPWVNQFFMERFQDGQARLEAESIDAIVTSPPYAMQRAKDYESVSEAEYPAYTVNWMSHAKRLLRPRGNVMLNLATTVRNGEWSQYVSRTVIALCDAGWIRRGEWIWHKTDSPPLGSSNQPRRAWEHLFWFALDRDSYCDTKYLGIESKRLGLLSKKRPVDDSGTVTSGIARGTDVISAGVSANDRSSGNTHSAQMPVAVAKPCVGRLCPYNGIVLDPFLGAGTTALAAWRAGRQYVGFDNDEGAVRIAKERLAKAQQQRRR